MDFEGMLEEQSGGMGIMCCFSQGNGGRALGSTSYGMQSVLMLGFSGANAPKAVLGTVMWPDNQPKHQSYLCFFFHVNHQSCKEVSTSPLHDNRRSLLS